MAKSKKKKRNAEIDTVVGSLGAEALGLNEPLPSCPSRPPKIGMYFTKGENRMYKGFCTVYAARKFMDAVFEEDSLTRIRGLLGEDDTVLSDSGISLRVHQYLDAILSHEHSPDEEKWELPAPYTTDAIRFRSMGFEAPVYSTKAESGEAKPERVKKEPKEKRPSKEGLITIQQIAEELKMEPREARGILRKMKTPKPGCGWAWPEAEVKAIKKLIKDNQD